MNARNKINLQQWANDLAEQKRSGKQQVRVRRTWRCLAYFKFFSVRRKTLLIENFRKMARKSRIFTMIILSAFLANLAFFSI